MGSTADETGRFARLLRLICGVRQGRCRAGRRNAGKDADVSRVGLRRITGTRRCARLNRIGHSAGRRHERHGRRAAIEWRYPRSDEPVDLIVPPVLLAAILQRDVDAAGRIA